MPDGSVLKFPDMLRVEGIMAKGFGVICKFPMTDPDLKVQAKGIYAYLCACCGNDANTFPSVAKILDHLQISKDTYYKSIKQLKDQGYIRIEQNKVSNGQFANNIYTIVSNPKKFQDSGYEAKGTLHSSLAYTGLKMAGFGLIPRVIMYDSRLSITAKVIYAYLASFSGGGKVAFPAKAYIQRHLGIGDKTYRTHMKALTTTNYVTVIQRHVDGRLASNDYYLNVNPDEAAALTPKAARHTKVVSISSQRGKIPDTAQGGKKQDTVKQDAEEQEAGSQDAEIQDAALQDTELQDTVAQEAVCEETTINSFPKNSSPIINPSINRASYWTDGLTREEIIEVLEQEHMPYQRRNDYKIDISDNSILNMMEIIADFAVSGKNLKVQGVEHDRGEVLDRLMQLEVEDYEYILRKVSAIQNHIKNVRGYYLVCMYSAKTDHDMEMELEIKRDIG